MAGPVGQRGTTGAPTGDDDILVEPVRIGPKVTPNRFSQVPHSNGLATCGPLPRGHARGEGTGPTLEQESIERRLEFLREGRARASAEVDEEHPVEAPVPSSATP